MGGIDHYDKVRGYYNYHINCRKCYKYILWFLFDVYAFILCEEFSPLDILTVTSTEEAI